MERIYLDYNASTPIHKEVANEMKPYLDLYFGNPSSLHYAGQKSRFAIENAREKVAALINCKPAEIIFTSGGTESNNNAIKGCAYANKNKGRHLITSKIEHPAVTEVCKYLEKHGFRISYLDVDKYGLVDPAILEKTITKETIFISIMHANNEVGTIQPLKELSSIARKYSIIFHTDAAQSAGKIITDVADLDVDLLSIAGHKLYAPKGIGALYIREGTRVEKFMHGADHEFNRRAGTENVLEIVGLGKACEIAKRDLADNIICMNDLKKRLFQKLSAGIKIININGHPEKCLPNTLSLSFPGIDANTLLSELHDIAASAGAACHSDSVSISNVLEAMGVPIDHAIGTIRFSVGRSTTCDEIDRASDLIIDAVNRFGNNEEPISNKQQESIKLTKFTQGMGCACKLGPQYLEEVLKGFKKLSDDKNVLIGAGTSDDAAVYKIDNNTAIVNSIDFFTPMVNDPFKFGEIAAANALSDIYAMGAKPLFALNVVCFPSKRLALSVLKEIIAGARSKAKEAGIEILGGHSIEDNEPKFGLVVSGKIHPDRIISNSGARLGDKLILTKALGTGIICTGIKRGLVNKQTENAAIKTMSRLNKYAAECIEKFHINALTDITGFGLLGHLKEMLETNKLDVELYSELVPIIKGTAELVSSNIIPGGTRSNLSYIDKYVEWSKNVSDIKKIILADAQTSGGLLISVKEKTANKLIDELNNNGVEQSVIIGKITKRGDGLIKII